MPTGPGCNLEDPKYGHVPSKAGQRSYPSAKIFFFLIMDMQRVKKDIHKAKKIR